MERGSARGKAVPISPQQIIEQCRLKFVNILPNTLSRTPSARPQPPHDPLPLTILYRRDHIRQVMRQLSLFLQLAIQNCVLSSDPKIRTESLRLLRRFREYLSRDLE